MLLPLLPLTRLHGHMDVFLRMHGAAQAIAPTPVDSDCWPPCCGHAEYQHDSVTASDSPTIGARSADRS